MKFPLWEKAENTARYISINVKKVIIRTMILSGVLCGIAGMLLVSGAGPYHFRRYGGWPWFYGNHGFMDGQI